MAAPRRLLAICTTLAAVVFSTIVLAAPADAEVKVIHDRVGDGSNGTGGGGPRKFGDIGAVRINHGTEAVRIAVLPAPGGQLADFYSLYVDVNVGNPGPEFVVTTTPETERFYVNQVDDFDVHLGRLCSGRARYNFDTQVVKMTVPRSCLKTSGFPEPVRVRVSAQSQMDYENADWAPARRTFGPWVNVG